jgi:hypothetical protein
MEQAMKPSSILVLLLPLSLHAQSSTVAFGAPRDLSTHDIGIVLSADFNEDGIPDLAVVQATGQLDIFLGHGNDTFQDPISIYTKDGSALVSSDLNGDGHLDLVVGGGHGPGVYLGNGDGTFNYTGEWKPSGSAYYGFVVGDFDGDGTPDIAGIDDPHTIQSNSVLAAHGTGAGFSAQFKRTNLSFVPPKSSPAISITTVSST